MAGKVNTRLVISVFYRPGSSHLKSIEIKGREALELGMISAMPNISAEQSEKTDSWLIVIVCNPEDRPFWFGFYLGRNWCLDNRQIAVGCDK
jgi:hypothetical protein